MTELIEVVFEEVDKTSILDLFVDIVSMAEEIQSVQCFPDETTPALDIHLNQQALSAMLNSSESVTILVMLSNIRSENILIPNPQVRFEKYGNCYECSFNFNFHDLEEQNRTRFSGWTKDLHQMAIKLSSKYHIKNFFGGLDPASDKETRFFTDNKWHS